MANDLIHKARGVSDLKCHLVLTTKYRRKVLTDPMLTRLEAIFKALMVKWDGRLIEFNGERDPVHLLLQYTPQTEPSKLINNLKTVSSRYLRKEFVRLVIHPTTAQNCVCEIIDGWNPHLTRLSSQHQPSTVWCGDSRLPS
jgi:putative transposase